MKYRKHAWVREVERSGVYLYRDNNSRIQNSQLADFRSGGLPILWKAWLLFSHFRRQNLMTQFAAGIW